MRSFGNPASAFRYRLRGLAKRFSLRRVKWAVSPDGPPRRPRLPAKAVKSETKAPREPEEKTNGDGNIAEAF